MHNIFVYGTLKKGQPNYHIMTDPKLGKAFFKGRGQTVDKYPLVIAEEGNIPFLLEIPGTGRHIAGEIYLVDDQMLQFLDEFECCPDMYQRTIKRIEILEWEGKDDSPEERPAANTIECFVYSTTSYKPKWLSLTYHDCYDSYGTHGLLFISHLDR
ncbi:PREDICTED: gamma-glutamylaminecyclotransferase [Nanorana parkeri]|uniref:gamma-glutamylaminecyclotransferase n=1 Tax=Nanorana parkeri TaxID=125878 RepID=UPI00085489A5|nr:PREDICTED: gamma-glutamylaminecyclotransferase [Nanorana parkeri]